MELSSNFNSIENSGTIYFTTLINELRKQKKEIIDFAVGDPEFQALPQIIKATQEALRLGKTKYGEVSGVFELKSAIISSYDSCNEENIIITNGSKQALFNLFHIVLNPGDEVILIRPYWPSFSQQVKMAGGHPVVVSSKKHQLNLHEIEKAITDKTKAIVINSPNNPTGAVYPMDDLREIAKLAKKYDFFIISDEAYASITYDGLAHNSIYSIDEVRKQTIIIGSFSKSYYMSGFRIGYMVADKQLIKACTCLQGHTTGNVCTFAQYGAIAALSMEKETIARQRLELENKRDIACDYASELFDFFKPQGAFYLFLDVSRYLKGIGTSKDFGLFLLEKAGVATVPGEVFDMPGHVRISFAVSDEKLIKGFNRINGEIRKSYIS